MHPQTGKIIADSDMDRAMCYCYDRGGGQYTRLVPVDLLPVELSNIPRRVDTDEGMIVLPVPRQPGPDGQLADIQLETQPVVTPPSSPNGVAGDNIQSRIDSIVNASPGPSSGALVLSTRGFDGTTPTRALTQHGHGAGAGGSARREKIYCDKWIHDGTCAFTQQGCKYKHEMPHDRETQEKLGLFHGYPGWWKKQAVEQQRPLAIDDRPVSLSAGRAGFGSLGASTSMGSGLSTAVVSSNWRAGPGPVGDTGVNGSPASASPASGNGSIVGRGGTIGFGGTGRGNARQPRTFASFQPPAATYGPIGPPSRAGASGSGSASLSGSAAAPVTTRGTRALTASSAASNGTNDDIGGGGGHQQRSALDSTNPFAPLGDLNQPSARAARARRDEDSSNDTTADADEEQRGAPL
ncbi:putative c-x8-c-x5-c-x3-h type zinc finger protein [Diaporthe ampelina]|uniref:Putative c-x8-c-x5-c-x3-h type zinc finger protein n=1 Tax=Diaporthe ampelina TaxID=1214573 RepID=A0A0G2FE44_9PEZI|nr:putative c-x8-c-x5-c-x3-h type zinc finger protein [Diaporthe ampelina]